MKNIKICDNCTLIDSEKVKNILEEKYKAEVEVGCMGMCAVCQTKAFAVMDGFPIIHETEEELLESIDKKINE